MAQTSSYRTRLVHAAAALPLFFAIACTSTATRSTTAPSTQMAAAPTTARSRYISAAELTSAGGESTLDAVRRVHPEFLRVSTRAASSIDATGPSVYVNRVFAGDVSWLALIPILQVRDIVFLHPTDAHQQFGSRCPCGGGVILVRTSEQRDP